jgi:dynein heavy chain
MRARVHSAQLCWAVRSYVRISIHGLPCRFIAVRTCTQDKKRGGIYEAPCYRVKTRKGFNFITTFSLRTEEDKSKWTLRGVALLCSID